MKKITPKLILRRETLHALASANLAHARGGAQAADTGAAGCFQSNPNGPIKGS